MKVLIIDDSEMQHKIASIYLEKSGLNIEIVHAYDGAEGVCSAREHHPDLILLDVEMPVMDGVGALEKLKSDASIKNIPVVMCTSVKKSEVLAKCAGLGAASCINKPHGYKHLMAEIDRIFKNAEKRRDV
jgi:CheY-like chemotaxis protein